MTLYEKLIAAGLPVLSATESGSIIWQPGIPMTLAEIHQAEDIILQHINPTEYAIVLAMRADVQLVITEYQNMITRLDQIQNVGILTLDQTNFNLVVRAVKDLALYNERILKYHAQQVRTGDGISIPQRI